MGLDNKDFQGQAPDITVRVTHPAPEDTADVDAVEIALRDMLAQSNLLPSISDSADLAGYPGLQNQAHDE